MYIGNKNIPKTTFFIFLGHGLFSTTIYISKKSWFFGIVEKSDFFDTTVINS